MPIASTHLSPIDLAIVAGYLVAITIFGLQFSRRNKTQAKSLKSYFLADNTIPWWAISLSIVSAETSTLTIISIPGVAFAGDLGFLQVVLGYMLGRIVVAVLFLPRYFKGEMLTAYQLIDRRFGHTLHKVTAGLFLLTRAAAEGVRVFAISIVVGIAIDVGDVKAIAIISALTLLYTFEGGMAAVIWTDVVQMALYVAGTLVALWTLGHQVPGGWQHIHAVAAPLGKFHWLNFALNLTQSYTFWAGVLGGTFLTMASHGTDQLMVQRMLAARNLGESRLALLSSGVVIFVQFTLFLLIGVGLFVFYGLHPQRFASADRIFPTFIVHQMPHGIAGLLIAAILAAAMSNLSAALNSLASTTVIDFYMPFGQWQQSRNKFVPHPRPSLTGPRVGIGEADTSTAATIAEESKTSQETTHVSRLATIFWAIVLFLIAVYSIKAGGKGHVVEIALSIASVAYGCLLGVFLLGTLTRYATQYATIAGMICGFALNLWLWQGTFPMHLGALTIPKIAFTWYVLIGAGATFGIGSFFSVAFRHKRTAATAILALFSLASFAQTSRSSHSAVGVPDFSEVSNLINQAIAEKKLPGAVVLIGHDNKVVFEQAYGNRALEPRVEPMTEDTIFDMASLTKVIVTTTAILQLVDQHKLDLDAPVVRYLPEFAQNGKDKITVRELLTHYSGLPPDIDLKDSWGLAAPDKAEGIRRAMASVPDSPPGYTFKYSDINFITLGALVEIVSGEDLATYADRSIFLPLGMKDTSYFDRWCACGLPRSAPYGHPNPPLKPDTVISCASNACWPNSSAIGRTAPTAHDDQGTAATNPDFDHLLRGTVHDPTTRRMGGVAGHAGVFSTAHDMSLFAQALLDKLLHNTGPFPVSQATLKLATSPNEPATAVNTATIFTPAGDTTKGVASHGLGWDLNTAYSRPRGSIFPIATSAHPGSFGHTGFTGTSLWIDPTSDTYVILLSNAIHIPRSAPISHLRGDVATAAAKALGLTQSRSVSGALTAPSFAPLPLAKGGVSGEARPAFDPSHPCDSPVICDSFGAPISPAGTLPTAITSHAPKTFAAQEIMSLPLGDDAGTSRQLQLGIDTFEQTHFAVLKALAKTHRGVFRHGVVHIALLTNQSGVDSKGRRTIDVLLNADPSIKLTRIYTPEHGLFGKQDTENLKSETDPSTHLPVISLYGSKASDRRPRDLYGEDGVDAVVIDLQDVGVRFWTYEALLGYFLEATECHSDLGIIVLDRPNPIGGLAVQGNIADLRSYNAYTALPVRHGMTYGELAKYFMTQLPGALCATLQGPYQVQPLTVIPMRHWTRSELWPQTQLPWTPPSPNLKSPAAAILYPGVGLTEQTNLSVGRGTETPFEDLGAPWIDAQQLAAYLTARKIAGIEITPTQMTIAEDANHYPSHGQTIPAIHFNVIDPKAFDSPEFGIELLAALHHLYPAQFKLDLAKNLLANVSTLAALKSGTDPRDIAQSWSADLRSFEQSRKPYLLYQ